MFTLQWMCRDGSVHPQFQIDVTDSAEIHVTGPHAINGPLRFARGTYGEMLVQVVTSEAGGRAPDCRTYSENPDVLWVSATPGSNLLSVGGSQVHEYLMQIHSARVGETRLVIGCGTRAHVVEATVFEPSPDSVNTPSGSD